MAHPEHAVNARSGNSRTLAHKHYLQVTDEMFERAAGTAKAVQNPVQQVHASRCEDMQDDGGPQRGSSETPEHARTCASLPLRAQGLEPWTYGLKGRCSTS